MVATLIELRNICNININMQIIIVFGEEINDHTAEHCYRVDIDN